MLSPSERCAQSSHHLPTPLHSLYEPQNLHLNYHQLLSKVKGVCKEPITEAHKSSTVGLMIDRDAGEKKYENKVGLSVTKL